MTKGQSLLVLGEELRRRLLLNLLPRPLLILQVQLDLALVHCPSINGNNLEGKTDKQTNNMCTSNKGKQTNKQQTSRGSMCGGVDAGGGVELHSMWSPICNASEYVEELQRCIGEGTCQSMTLHIKLHTFLTHLQCISKALLHTLTHCVLDSICYATLHHPLHPHLCMCCLCLFVCLFPLPDCFC